MGDRVSVDVTVKKEHITMFLKHFEDLNKEPLLDEAADYSSTCDLREEAYDLVFEQVNYGGMLALMRAAEAGCLFFAQHGQGDSYGSWVFYSDGKTLHSWETGYGGDLVLPNFATPTLEKAVGFERRLRLIKWVLGALATGDGWCSTCHGYGMVPEGIASWELCPDNCGCGDASAA